jgi:hypothetical protein
LATCTAIHMGKFLLDVDQPAWGLLSEISWYQIRLW